MLCRFREGAKMHAGGACQKPLPALVSRATSAGVYLGNSGAGKPQGNADLGEDANVLAKVVPNDIVISASATQHKHLAPIK